jgi:hypothetical protein
MKHIKVVSLAVFAASFLVSLAMYRVVNAPVSGALEAGQRYALLVPDLGMQPLFSTQTPESSQE